MAFAPSGGAGRASRWAAAVVMILIAAWTVFQSANVWAFSTDDAFITLRYARNWALGHGVTWNVGDEPKVEGYSNFSYLAIAALTIKLGGDPLLVLKLVGVASLVGTYGVLFVLARRWVSPLAATIPSFLFAAYPGTVFWTVSGLETSFYTLCALGAVTALVRALRFPEVERAAEEMQSPSIPLLALAGAIAALASITRPEGPIVAVALGLGLVVHFAKQERPWQDRVRAAQRPALALVAGFVVPYGLYFAWRFSYYGRLLPNTVYCKVGGDETDLTLLTSFSLLALPYLPFALSHAPRRLDARHVALWALVLLYALAVIGADPILGYYNRHVLTAWAALLVLASTGLAGLTALLTRIRPALRDVLAIGVAVTWVSFAGAGRAEAPLGPYTAMYERRSAVRHELGTWLAQRLAPTDRYLLGDCGVVPYVAGGTAVDAFCLNNRAMTTEPIHGSVDRFVQSIVEDPPEYIIVHSSEYERLVPRPEYGFYRRLLRQKALQSEYALLAKFGAPGDAFHYWVFGAKKVAEGR